MAEIRILVDSYASSASVKETNANIEKMLVLLKQVDKYKDVLNKAVSMKDVIGATQKLGALQAQIVKIQQEEEKLAALRQKTTQQGIVGEEKIAQAKNATAKSTIAVEEAQQKQAASTAKVSKEIEKETGLLGALKKQMNDLNKQKLLAKTPEDIAKINTQLNTLKGNYKKLADSGKASTNTWANALSSFQFKFNFLGNLVAHGAMMIGQAISSAIFDSVDSFMGAEKNAKQLELALRNVGGEGSIALKTLLDQSNELQDNGIFSDDAIQQTQTQLANYGLTSSAIKDLTPQITDLAAANGIDLATATDLAIKGINGQTKGLKMLGIDFKATGDKTKNLALLTDKLSKFQGANAAQMFTTAGRMERLKNKWDDLKETFGGWLVKGGTEFLDWWDVLTGKLSLGQKAFIDFRNAFEPIKDDMLANFKKTAEGIDDPIKKNQYYINSLQNVIAEYDNITKQMKTATGGQYEALKAQADVVKGVYDGIVEYLKTAGNKVKETGDDVTNTLTDLSDQLLAAQKQFYDDEFDLQRYQIERMAKMREHDANQTITDQTDLELELLRIKEDEITQLAELDKQKLHEEASYRIAEIQAENASAEQRALLIKEVEDKLQRDLEQIDRKAADDKIDAEIESFDKLSQIIDDQNQQTVENAQETNDAVERVNKDGTNAVIENEDDLLDQMKKVSDEVENQLNEISDARQQHLKDDISAQEDNVKRQQQLADAGLENTLAFEERKKAEMQRAQIAEEERQRRLKKIESYWNLFTEYAKDDPSTAALKAAEQIAISEAIVAAFAEKGGMGEDLKEVTTFKGGEWDRSHASGDVLTMISPKEGILTEREVEALGGKKGFYDLKYSLQRMAENPLSDDLFNRQHDSFSSAAFIVNKPVDLSPMSEKLDNIEKAIKDKPVPSWSIDGLGHFIETIRKQGSRITTDKGPITRRKKLID